MTTEKQLVANFQNAQLSTGPTTLSGKAIVATNAIKHGIFTKDLILTSDIGQESEDEYRGILNNLIDCLSPCNQMESLLVEKIAVDFWRVRRTIRFETGSIAKGIQKLLVDTYSYGKQDNKKLEEELQHKNKQIAWNTTYLDFLAKGEVTFDKPMWEQNEFSSDILDDFYMIAKTFKSLTKEIREKLYYTGDFDFDELQALLKKNGYSEAKAISTKLIEIYANQNRSLEEDIQKLTQQKIENEAANSLTYMLGMTPATDNADKILKYERSLQKSIYQNLFMLKKLQGVF